MALYAAALLKLIYIIKTHKGAKGYKAAAVFFKTQYNTADLPQPERGIAGAKKHCGPPPFRFLLRTGSPPVQVAQLTETAMRSRLGYCPEAHYPAAGYHSR